MASATGVGARIGIAACSEVGARSRNEDAVGHGRGAGGWFAVLADGLGGHASGAVAARLAVEAVAQALRDAPAWRAAVLREAVARAHDAINAQQAGREGRDRMHATIVVLWVDASARRATWAHLGDSRLYRVRRGQAQQLTRDDTVMQQLVDAGLLSPAEARTHPRRGELLGALGTDEAVHVHIADGDGSLREGDAFLLCSDGWWDAVEPHELEDSCAEARDAQDWLFRMAQLIRARARPGQDNYSAVALWVGDAAQRTLAAPG